LGSGLLYEIAKNLALSGVGNIVILTSHDQTDQAFHELKLDDLGNAYQRAARAEVEHIIDDTDNNNDAHLLVEYLHRLNPSVKVATVPRSDFDTSCVSGGQRVLVCIDRPYATQVHLNKCARRNGSPFVATETAGVYGRVFSYFGDSFEVHDTDGELPLETPLDHMELLEPDEPQNRWNSPNVLQVHCVDWERHDVSKGDLIEFQLRGAHAVVERFQVLRVQSPHRFTVQCVGTDDPRKIIKLLTVINENAISFRRIKLPQLIRFLPLEAVMTHFLESKDGEVLLTPCDFDKSLDPIRRVAILSCFHALSQFVTQHHRLPRVDDDIQSFLSTANVISPPDEDSVPKSHQLSFASTCAAKFTPLQAFFGGLAAQEALKAVSGLYNPVQQFLFYDCDELLDDQTSTDSTQRKCANTGQSYILGSNFDRSLASSSLFVVGAGAIGCELLKNLAAMGAGTGFLKKKGCVIVTDMDTIEKSNLSRQLLFRDADIGSFKSTAARKATLRFNANMEVEAHTSKVGAQDESQSSPFDEHFWSKRVDIVLNALDNIEARLYIDGMCVSHKKALIDAGTLGSKGNVQVVIPHQSESYGSSIDPPEPSIPVCTIKNFPFLISHTIQWARDLFDGYFQRRPRQANQYRQILLTQDASDLAKHLIFELGEQVAIDLVTELVQDLAVKETHNITFVRELSIRWAANEATKFFRDNVNDLLQQHPIGSKDEDGEPFWSGSRRVPRAISYSLVKASDTQQLAINKQLISFVKAAALLRMETFGPRMGSGDYSVTDTEAEAALTNAQSGVSSSNPMRPNATVQEVVAESLSNVLPVNSRTLNIVEFEKDDDSNGHVAFVAAASNLRALCYGISPVDSMETRRVAGKIVPAMISTTSIVSALSCIELTKLIQNATLKRHRNAFINLALPFFAFTEPLPAERVTGIRGATYTLWDRINVKEGKKAAAKGGLTLRNLIKRVKKKAGIDSATVDVSSISYGPYMIYAKFLHEGDKELLERSIWDIVNEAIQSGDEFDDEFSRDDKPRMSVSNSKENRNSIDLIVVAEDLENGEEVELPAVCLTRSNQ
jgi:ubiquitin-activating enzyme E1